VFVPQVLLHDKRSDSYDSTGWYKPNWEGSEIVSKLKYYADKVKSFHLVDLSTVAFVMSALLTAIVVLLLQAEQKSKGWLQQEWRLKSMQPLYTCSNFQ
jgi:hypothetical protein